jgi:DNA (cytosine-5)-methyltransferase 1
LREAMLLQSFPENAELRGTGDQMALQIGNAIPPLLARRVGDVVATMEKISRKLAQDAALVPSTRVPHRASASSSLATSST